MRPVLALALALLAVLGGCASLPSDRPSVLGGVDLDEPLRALGTEPFWRVELDGGRMVFSGADAPDLHAARPRPVVGDGAAVFTAVASTGQTLVLVLNVRDCTDGMSDDVYPLTAVMRAGDAVLNGCAAPVPHLEAAGD